MISTVYIDRYMYTSTDKCIDQYTMYTDSILVNILINLFVSIDEFIDG